MVLWKMSEEYLRFWTISRLAIKLLCCAFRDDYSSSETTTTLHSFHRTMVEWRIVSLFS